LRGLVHVSEEFFTEEAGRIKAAAVARVLIPGRNQEDQRVSGALSAERMAAERTVGDARAAWQAYIRDNNHPETPHVQSA
jgi:hypothetical protein